MNQETKIIISPTEDLKNFAIRYEGPNSYQTSVAMALAVILNTTEQFFANVPPTEDLESIKTVVYDDLNIRFSNLLTTIIPDEDLGLDFTEQAQQAIHDEDQYIQLKFAELQYLKLKDLLEQNPDQRFVLNEKGEVECLEDQDN